MEGSIGVQGYLNQVDTSLAPSSYPNPKNNVIHEDEKVL